MNPPLEIVIARHCPGWPKAFDPLAISAIHAALAASKAEVKGVAELSIVLTDDEEQRALNQKWRGKDEPTNVLSFPQIAPFAPIIGLLGDIILARQTLEREARDLGKPLTEHFTHLIVHGFLHILGYDHIKEPDALAMENLETDILARLGISDPYDNTEPDLSKTGPMQSGKLPR